jgi:pyrimidine-specific ribonucleoside hydrolase
VTDLVTDVVLDLDTGTDDAMALLLALRAPQLRLRAVTCVDGNVDVDRAVANTLRVLDAVGAPDVPVARGAAHPLRRRPSRRSGSSHGPDGLGNLDLPAPRRASSAEGAVSLLSTLSASRNIAYVGCGPATNLALLLEHDAAAARAYDRVLLVAGPSDDEFNSAHDPDAQAAVRASALAVSYVGVDVLYAATVDHAGRAALAAAADPAARLASALVDWRVSVRGAAMIGDAAAVARLIVPGASPPECAELFVRVLTTGP